MGGSKSKKKQATPPGSPGRQQRETRQESTPQKITEQTPASPATAGAESKVDAQSTKTPQAGGKQEVAEAVAPTADAKPQSPSPAAAAAKPAEPAKKEQPATPKKEEAKKEETKPQQAAASPAAKQEQAKPAAAAADNKEAAKQGEKKEAAKPAEKKDAAAPSPAKQEEKKKEPVASPAPKKEAEKPAVAVAAPKAAPAPAASTPAQPFSLAGISDAKIDLSSTGACAKHPQLLAVWVGPKGRGCYECATGKTQKQVANDRSAAKGLVEIEVHTVVGKQKWYVTPESAQAFKAANTGKRPAFHSYSAAASGASATTTTSSSSAGSISSASTTLTVSASEPALAALAVLAHTQQEAGVRVVKGAHNELAFSNGESIFSRVGIARHLARAGKLFNADNALEAALAVHPLIFQAVAEPKSGLQRLNAAVEKGEIKKEVSLSALVFWEAVRTQKLALDQHAALKAWHQWLEDQPATKRAVALAAGAASAAAPAASGNATAAATSNNNNAGKDKKGGKEQGKKEVAPAPVVSVNTAEAKEYIQRVKRDFNLSDKDAQDLWLKFSLQNAAGIAAPANSADGERVAKRQQAVLNSIAQLAARIAKIDGKVAPATTSSTTASSASASSAPATSTAASKQAGKPTGSIASQKAKAAAEVSLASRLSNFVARADALEARMIELANSAGLTVPSLNDERSRIQFRQEATIRSLERTQDRLAALESARSQAAAASQPAVKPGKEEVPEPKPAKKQEKAEKPAAGEQKKAERESKKAEKEAKKAEKESKKGEKQEQKQQRAQEGGPQTSQWSVAAASEYYAALAGISTEGVKQESKSEKQQTSEKESNGKAEAEQKPQKAEQPAAKSAPTPATPAAAAGAAAEPAKKGEDEFDLWAEDDEDAEKQREIMKKARENELAKQKAGKVRPVAKSVVVIDVKPWEDTTDLKYVEEEVRKIAMDGLEWKAGVLAAIGYGIKKLQISCHIEDDKVSVDDILERIQEGLPDHVQSCDVHSFSKL